MQNKEVSEDEIDLKEIFQTILKYKKKIAIFIFIVFTCTLIFVISIPNTYSSSITLSEQSQSKSVSSSFSSLASLAGVTLPSDSKTNSFTLMQTLLKDSVFNEYMIKKYDLVKKINDQKELVFAFNFSFFYDLFHSKSDEKMSIDEQIFQTSKLLLKIISVSKDEKTSLITLSVKLNDRFLAKKLVDIYLFELVQKLKSQDIKQIDKQIIYYQKELAQTQDISLKEQLSKSLSALFQKKVFSQANEFYLLSKVTDSSVPYIKDKVAPRRSLILAASLVTSLILGVFLSLFYEFIKNEKQE